MPGNEQEEAYERLVLATLTRILDSQKFAETKNAALLTFNSAWVIGGSNLLFSEKVLPGWLPLALGLALPLLTLSAFGCLLSFMPVIELKKFLRRRRWLARWMKPSKPHVPSMIYFGDIAAVDPAYFPKKMERQYLPTDGRSMTDAYKLDLANQVAINSFIAARKFRLFTQAVWVTFIAMILISLSIISAISEVALDEMDALRAEDTAAPERYDI